MKIAVVFLLSLAASVSAWSQKAPVVLVFVQGGSFKNVKSNYYGRSSLPSNPYLGKPVAVASFYIGKYELTQKEWSAVMGSNPSKFQGEDLPVDTVSWYDCIEYCNRRSEIEGLSPCYSIDRAKQDPNNTNPIDDIKWTVTINAGANGYRLPTEAEWEYAAGGGQLSKVYTYCGSENLEAVAWYYRNSGDSELTGFWSWPAIEANHCRTRPVGTRAPNELGLYDMSGNVREWCWNGYSDSPAIGTEPSTTAEGRVWRGGGWLGGDFCCASSYRAGFEASGKGPDQGFRVCRDK